MQEYKTAVITGCSSGIGRACTQRLVGEGFRIFAGVRRPEDGEKLKTEIGPNLIPIIVEVTDAESIQAAAIEVEGKLNGSGLGALVNVAGIGSSGPLEFVTPADLRHVFEVDVFGQIAVTQAFLPMLHKSQGRIVNVSSVGAHIAIPFGGALCAAKGAFGLLSDALRLELRPFGVRVCTVEPGAIYTPAVDKTLGDVESVIGKLPKQGVDRYAHMLRTFTSRAYARERNGSPPEVVANAVLSALTDPHPSTRYVVGKHARLLTLFSKILPDRLLDALRAKMFGLTALAARS